MPWLPSAAQLGRLNEHKGYFGSQQGLIRPPDISGTIGQTCLSGLVLNFLALTPRMLASAADAICCAADLHHICCVPPFYFY